MRLLRLEAIRQGTRENLCEEPGNMREHPR